MKTARNVTWLSVTRLVFAVCLVAIGRAGPAAEPATDLKHCAELKNERERLQCYDAAAERGEAKPAEPLEQLGRAPSPAVAPGATPLSVRWELEPATKQGTWLIRPYEPVFILPVRYSNKPNESPQSPTHPAPFPVPLDHNEIEFQLSLKVKAAQNLFGSHADLWFSYTQESHWQEYNSQGITALGGKYSTSNLFRETDYMPQVFVTFPTQYDLFGLTGRFVNVGLWHQSNGGADPVSRAWNRVFAQFGFERGNFALYVRPWARIHESGSADDNPDITRYMGHGDVQGIYLWGRQEFSLLGRLNGGNVTLQGTWSFPISGRLHGYVKLFSGYGETILDYNWKQNTIGIGISLVDWL